MLKPWITKDILKKCDERNNLLKMIKDESDPEKIVTLRKEYTPLPRILVHPKKWCMHRFPDITVHAPLNGGTITTLECFLWVHGTVLCIETWPKNVTKF